MRALLLFSLLLSACAANKWKPGPVREPEPIMRRGWSFVEPSYDLPLTGLSPVSYSGPLVVAEKLVFGSDRFGLTVLSKRTGQLLWRKPFPDGVAAVPYSQDGKVYVGTETGEVVQLDLDSGKQNWSVNLGAPTHGSLAMAFGRLYVGTADEALHALDPGTGKVAWTYRRPSFSGTSIRGGGNPSVVDGRIWIGFSDGALVSLRPETGTVEFERVYRDNLKFMDLDAKVIGWKDGLLVSTYDGKLRHLRKDGSLIWEFAAGGSRAPIVSEGDVVYLPSSDGTIYAISGGSGKELWRYALRRGVPTGAALVERSGKKVLVVTGSEEKVLAISTSDGKLLAESSLGRGSGSYGPIAVDKDTSSFFVLSGHSRIYQYVLRPM